MIAISVPIDSTAEPSPPAVVVGVGLVLSVLEAPPAVPPSEVTVHVLLGFPLKFG